MGGIMPDIFRSLADIEGIFSRADVSAQEPFVAMGRLGIKIINPPMET